MDKFLSFFKTCGSKIKTFYKKYYEIINPTAVLTVICIVVTLALSSTNLLTEKRIDELSVKAQKATMEKLIVAEVYNEFTEKFGEDEVTYHIALSSDNAESKSEIVGYVFTIKAKGYGGDISVMTAVNTDGTVAAVNILDASGETPGLGQNITKYKFYSQYKGLKNGITVSKNDAKENEIQAVTGATVSSKAVTNAVNKALEYAEQIIAKGEAK